MVGFICSVKKDHYASVNVQGESSGKLDLGGNVYSSNGAEWRRLRWSTELKMFCSFGATNEIYNQMFTVKNK